MKNELEDMKQIWQNASGSEASLTEQQLLNLLTMRSKTALTRLRSNLLLEAVLAVLVVAFFAYKCATASDEQTVFSLTQVCFIISPLFLFYYYGLKNLNKGISNTGDLQATLTEAVSFWERAIRLYFWGGMFLFPVFIIAINTYRSSLYGTESSLFYENSPMVVLGKTLAITALVGLVVWLLIKVSYGVYIRRLKNCLQELREAG